MTLPLRDLKGLFLSHYYPFLDVHSHSSLSLFVKFAKFCKYTCISLCVFRIHAILHLFPCHDVYIVHEGQVTQTMRFVVAGNCPQSILFKDLRKGRYPTGKESDTWLACFILEEKIHAYLGSILVSVDPKDLGNIAASFNESADRSGLAVTKVLDCKSSSPHCNQPPGS